MNFLFNLYKTTNAGDLNRNLSEIDARSNAVISSCGGEDNFVVSLQYKFAYDKVSAVENEFTKFIVFNHTENDRTIIEFYMHLLKFVKESCSEESVEASRRMFGQNPASNPNHLVINSHDSFVAFIKTKSIDHWFFPFLCSCEGFSCLKPSEEVTFNVKLNQAFNMTRCPFSTTPEASCFKPIKITLETVNSLISEILEYLQAISEKRARGSVSQTKPFPRSSASRTSASKSPQTTPVSRSSSSRSCD